LLAWVVKQRIVGSALVAVFLIAACTAFGKPHRPYMLRADQNRAQMTRAMQYVRTQIPSSDLIFVDYQTRLLLAHYLCAEQPMSFSNSGIGLEEFSCGGYKIVAAGSETYTFTTENFLRWRDELHRTYPLSAERSVWVVQVGWEINLAHDLGNRFPEFHDLKLQSFGRNITIFELPGH